MFVSQDRLGVALAEVERGTFLSGRLARIELGRRNSHQPSDRTHCPLVPCHQLSLWFELLVLEEFGAGSSVRGVAHRGLMRCLLRPSVRCNAQLHSAVSTGTMAAWQQKHRRSLCA